MMDEHIRIGSKYRSVKLHTTYSFGLDDQEFVVAFETDYPSDFLDLVQELRETKASSDRKSTRLNSSHLVISYAVFCLKKKKIRNKTRRATVIITTCEQIIAD